MVLKGSKVELQAAEAMADLGARLRELQRRARRASGRRLTCRELAERTGYGRTSISNWLQGRSLPTADRLDDLLIALEATRSEQRALATARDLIEERRKARPLPPPGPASPGTAPQHVLIPHELPPDVDAFTGRSAELAELDRILEAAEPSDTGTSSLAAMTICAISGMAGAGKTALAVRWAYRVIGNFPDGQLYLNLRGFDPCQQLSAEEALVRLLHALGMQGKDIPLSADECAARYRSLVHGKRILILLDNASDAEHIRLLLPGSGPTVLVTSRNSLAGLVARDGARRVELNAMPAADAMALLRTLIGDRVDADPAAAETLARACARLPLALRVASERAATQPGRALADMAAELDVQKDRLDLLDAGGDPRTGVGAVFSWSYRHLPTPAAKAFRLLSLHPGPDWDRYSAAALTATAPDEAQRLLTALAHAHLIQASRPARYNMHDLLRDYASRLCADEDGDDVRRLALSGLFDYYLAAAAAAMTAILPEDKEHQPVPGPRSPSHPLLGDPARARSWLDTELPTLVALAAYTSQHGWPEHTMHLAATLHRYLNGACLSEALTIHGYAVCAASATENPAAEADALNRLGAAYKQQGDQQQAIDCHNRALTLFRELGDRLGAARALGNLGNAYERKGLHRQAADCYHQVLALSRELGDHLNEARCLSNLSLIHAAGGRYGCASD